MDKVTLLIGIFAGSVLWIFCNGQGKNVIDGTKKSGIDTVTLYSNEGYSFQPHGKTNDSSSADLFLLVDSTFEAETSYIYSLSLIGKMCDVPCNDTSPRNCKWSNGSELFDVDSLTYFSTCIQCGKCVEGLLLYRIGSDFIGIFDSKQVYSIESKDAKYGGYFYYVKDNLSTRDGERYLTIGITIKDTLSL